MTDHTVIILRDRVYLTLNDTATYYNRCTRSIRNDIQKMKDSGRYDNRRMVLDPSGKMLLNSLMYEDYLAVKEDLKHKNLARKLEPYDSAAVRKARGEYTA